MEDIAAAAGVSLATAYHHFPSEQARVGPAVALLLSTRLARAEHGVAEERPAVEALNEQLRGHTEIVFQHRKLAIGTLGRRARVQDPGHRGRPPR